MEEKKNILILTYYFPPSGDIGGRRWAKLGKYLHRDGHDVTVLAADFKNNEKSNWNSDIAELNTLRYKTNYPEILEKIPVGLIDKIKYKLALRKVRIRTKDSGTMYDRAIFLKEVILNEAEKIIKDNHIDIIIANGPPHRILYYGALLKKKHPNVFLVSDFRDPWTWWYNYGYQDLSDIDKKEEEKMEGIVISSSDLITVPAPEMKNHLVSKYNISKVELLEHGFDRDDIKPVEKLKKKETNGINLVYFGNLYDGERKRFTIIADCIRDFDHVHFDIYSSTNNYSDVFSERGCKNVRYHSSQPSPKIFDTLRNYDAVLMVMPDKFSNYFTSKFYEILYLGLPIVLVSKKGELSEFIVSNHLGVHFDKNLKDDFTSLCKGQITLDKVDFPAISDFSFASLTEKLFFLIKKNKSLE